MKINIKTYSGLIVSVIYSLIVRYLAEWDVIEINSISYLIITPIISGYLPFVFGNKNFTENIYKSISLPIISTLLFLTIAVITKIEELICFVIIGIPYLIVSVLVSLYFRNRILNSKNTDTNKNYLPFVFLPLILGVMEKNSQKEESNHLVQNQIEINASSSNIWKCLHEVPNLSKFTQTSLINYLGVPKPVHSTYDSINNIRLGYFDNGLILHENVIETIHERKLGFAINFSKSNLNQNLTIKNIVKEKSMIFDGIYYELIPLNNSKTILKLKCHYRLKTNLTPYANYITHIILNDFENNLLGALKSKLENKN
ncbi:hypothetical protein SAMN05443543_10844 [Flavobacterium flevense]|uniref:Polyketide cyclase n=1 Tax=Flavobacterium flevense TaxID=983 RepID=A0A4Y4AW81_9FLAO|nr:hypothetical protein [Flavobacterium flevense]GEC72396.1 hypothetical protein FFL01_19350 [Flavobacterium flevense]SHL97717.1 hypothetical protein SAMN05443543_10844 [Flavobacterium flevense]